MLDHTSITKSIAIKSKQCKKLCWFLINTPNDGLENDSLQQFYMQQSDTVGLVAQQLFPYGRSIKKEWNNSRKVSKTKALILDCCTIFHATFIHKNTQFTIDVLEYSNGYWNAYGIKSSASLKPSQLWDLAFQANGLNSTDISIHKFYAIHINSNYVRHNTLNLQELLITHDVTHDIKRRIPHIQQSLTSIQNISTQTSPPNIPIGMHCFQPKQCPAFSKCWNAPQHHSVFSMHGTPIFDKYNYYCDGKTTIDSLNELEFSKKIQQIQIVCQKEDLDYVNVSKIKQFLNKITPPISFFDIEAFQSPIPPFSNVSPFDQIPFLFSLQIMKTINSTPKQCYFFPNTTNDPRYEFAKSLIKQCPKKGSILVFNKSYEALALKKLAQQFPKLAPSLNAISQRFIDLATPFQDCYIYLRKMNGQCSIKTILPSIAPQINYSDLTIESGAMANKAINDYITKKNINKAAIKSDLIEYCTLDTTALILITQTLQNICND